MVKIVKNICFLCRKEQKLEDQEPQTQGQGLPERSQKSSIPLTSFIQHQSQSILSTVTGGSLMSAVQPDLSLPGQQTSFIQQGVVLPFTQKNMHQPFQQPQPINQQQSQPNYQQPRPFIQQQVQTSFQKQRPLMQTQAQLLPNQQPQLQALPLMQQQLQGQGSLVSQPQLLPSSGMNISVKQQHPQLSQPQAILQQQQMMLQGSLSSQQNISMEMPNMVPQQKMSLTGPQQNIKMAGPNTPMVGTNIQMAGPNHNVIPFSQPSVIQQEPQYNGNKNPVLPAFSKNQTLSQRSFNQQNTTPTASIRPVQGRLNDQQQMLEHSINSQKFPQNVQHPALYQREKEKLNKEPVKKYPPSDFTSRKEPDPSKSGFSNYRIPKKHSSMKSLQESHPEAIQRGNDSRKTENHMKKDASRSLITSQPDGTQSHVKGNGGDESASRYHSSRNNRSRSRESRSSSSRRDRSQDVNQKREKSRYNDYRDGGKSRDSKEKSDRHQHMDHRVSGTFSENKDESNKFRYTDHRDKGTKKRDEANSRSFHDKCDEKSSSSKSSERKSGSFIEIGGKINKDSSRKSAESKSGSSIKIDNEIDKDSENRSKSDKENNIQISVISYDSINKLPEGKQVIESRNEQWDMTEQMNANKNNSFDDKSGSYIEFGNTDSSSKSKKKDESCDNSSVITVDLIPSEKCQKRKHVKNEPDAESRAKQAKISSTTDTRLADIPVEISITPFQSELKEEKPAFKFPVETHQEKLSCSVTVDLVDISKLSKVKLEELKQQTFSSPLKDRSRTESIPKPFTIHLDSKPKIKAEVKDTRLSAATNSSQSKYEDTLNDSSRKTEITSSESAALAQQQNKIQDSRSNIMFWKDFQNG